MKRGWNEPLPPFFYRGMGKLKSWFLESRYHPFPSKWGQDNKSCTLHVFWDASAKAYEAVTYLVSDDKSNILTTKARVTPMKDRSLSQLELTAIQVRTQPAKYVTNTLKTLNIENVFIWSDDEATLQWIKNNNSNILYVRNRVANITSTLTTYHPAATRRIFCQEEHPWINYQRKRSGCIGLFG